MQKLPVVTFDAGRLGRTAVVCCSVLAQLQRRLRPCTVPGGMDVSSIFNIILQRFLASTTPSYSRYESNLVIIMQIRCGSFSYACRDRDTRFDLS